MRGKGGDAAKCEEDWSHKCHDADKWRRFLCRVIANLSLDLNKRIRSVPRDTGYTTVITMTKRRNSLVGHILRYTGLNHSAPR